MIIPKTYLISLLNELALQSGRVEVVYPPVGMLFSIDIGNVCTIYTMNHMDYRTNRNSYLKWKDSGSQLNKEIPQASDLKICLYASNILNSDNEGEILDIIKDGISRDLLKGQKPLFIGYDNNSLRHMSNHIVENAVLQLKRHSEGRIGYCLSETVKNELRGRWDVKYKYEEIKELLKDIKFAKEFLNQPPKDARMARLAAVEYKRIMTLANCQEAPGRGYGDNNIINSYERFRDSRNVDVVLISGDNNFTSMAHEEKMQAIYLKQPQTYTNELETTWEKTVELLYLVSIVFGFIQINGISLYGIWKGKTGDQWDNYKLNLDVDKKEKQSIVFRDIRILLNGEL